MFLRRFTVKNLRSVLDVSMDFDRGQEAGWHVILGTNGSGKSSFIRAFALLMMGEREAYASRQDFGLWIRSGETKSEITATLSMDGQFDYLSGQGPAYSRNSINAIATIEALEEHGAAEIEFSGERVQRTLWGGGRGWFSASFGPFRRFTGGDRVYDRLFVLNKRLAPHLTALGEDVALTEAVAWLTALYVRSLHEKKTQGISSASEILEGVKRFLNESTFLPHGAQISEISDVTVYVTDGNGFKVPLDQLSDGYRSALSLVVELIRQMFEIYGADLMLHAMSQTPGTVQAPGIVAIDEVDAHLHPTWQRDIGLWITRCFPKVQFLVATHSPIVCRAIVGQNGQIAGSVWKLPTPGTDEIFQRVEGDDLDMLLYGDILDAYSTELFGRNITRSASGKEKLERLAALNLQARNGTLSAEENSERTALRRLFPADIDTAV